MSIKGRTRILSALMAFFFLRPGAVPAAAAEGKIIVSLGDSYASGEGVEPFYGQEEVFALKSRNPDWLAHRSRQSWPGMLTLPAVDGPMRDHRGENWFFVAASGAKSQHLYLLSEEEISQGKTAQQEKKFNREFAEGARQLDPQLQIFDELDARGLKADYVTVTIGGNDLGFDKIIGLGLSGSMNLIPYKAIQDHTKLLWESYYLLSGVRGKIKRAYRDIAARAGSQAWIIVAGYPRILDPDCGKSQPAVFSDKTADIINRMATLFNEELRNIVEECRGEGIRICFVSVEEAFDGHGAYAEDPWINPVIAKPQEQDLKETAVMSMYSMHPNAKGCEAYAACVQEMINRLEAGQAE